MVVAAVLSALHLLTLALGLSGVIARGRALSGTLDEAGWRRLLAADNAWGIAAALWITTGLARVFWGGREPGFYWSNGFFWVKVGLFGIVFLLELRPMITFVRVRTALARGTPLPEFAVQTFRRINAIEVALVLVIVFTAAFMARGAWMF